MSRKEKEGRGKSSKTSKRLIDVSIDLFSRKGFKGTSIRDIAAEMGMTTSNIYHYFGTKAGLLSAIERQTLEPLIKEFRRIASLELPPLDRFKLLIRTHLTFQDSHRNESKIFSLREESFPHGKKDLNKKFQTETFFIYRSEIERLLASMGREGNSTIAAFSTLGAVVWVLRWYNPEGSSSLEEVIEAISEHVLYGIIGERPPNDK
jgi:AcrR family transcriptional regulator